MNHVIGKPCLCLYSKIIITTLITYLNPRMNNKGKTRRGKGGGDNKLFYVFRREIQC
uniref:Uncharacterized protein n=1 Tax=Octopus bimaculoides TaxID=37653 RepID=A0A0L8HD88_OCTBM